MHFIMLIQINLFGLLLKVQWLYVLIVQVDRSKYSEDEQYNFLLHEYNAGTNGFNLLQMESLEALLLQKCCNFITGKAIYLLQCSGNSYTITNFPIRHQLVHLPIYILVVTILQSYIYSHCVLSCTVFCYTDANELH